MRRSHLRHAIALYCCNFFSILFSFGWVSKHRNLLGRLIRSMLLRPLLGPSPLTISLLNFHMEFSRLGLGFYFETLPWMFSILFFVFIYFTLHISASLWFSFFKLYFIVNKATCAIIISYFLSRLYFLRISCSDNFNVRCVTVVADVHHHVQIS